MKLLLGLLVAPFLLGQAVSDFEGTWEARFKDEVICTIRIQPGEKITGEFRGCQISVDENGDLQEPEEAGSGSPSSPFINPRIEGGALVFEQKDEDDEEPMEFRLTLDGAGRASLRFVNVPVKINPVAFVRKPAA
jgi:hypothetical protein